MKLDRETASTAKWCREIGHSTAPSSKLSNITDGFRQSLLQLLAVSFLSLAPMESLAQSAPLTEGLLLDGTSVHIIPLELSEGDNFPFAFQVFKGDGSEEFLAKCAQVSIQCKEGDLLIELVDGNNVDMLVTNSGDFGTVFVTSERRIFEFRSQIGETLELKISDWSSNSLNDFEPLWKEREIAVSSNSFFFRFIITDYIASMDGGSLSGDAGQPGGHRWNVFDRRVYLETR